MGPLSQSGLGLASHFYIDLSEVVLNDKIHESELSVIYEGEYNGHEVAVKIFNPNLVDLASFREEFQLIRCLSPLTFSSFTVVAFLLPYRLPFFFWYVPT